MRRSLSDCFSLLTKSIRDGVETRLKEACSPAYPESAICVQRFDDSLNSAIRITYRISLRSSSLREPRYPLLRVVLCFVMNFISEEYKIKLVHKVIKMVKMVNKWNTLCKLSIATYCRGEKRFTMVYTWIRDNDPSAGSPTETLLRLLLPLNDQVWFSSRMQLVGDLQTCNNPWSSLSHSIGSSDGRCVQRAGT